MNTKEKVHYDDAPIKWTENISGWVGADGRFYGTDEHLARYANSDTATCRQEGCEAHVSKGWLICSSCINKKNITKWQESEKRPVMPSDEFYYSDALDEYFSDWDEVLEHADEEGVALEDMLLYHCVRESPPEFDVMSLYEDITPEGHDIHDMVTAEIIAAADHLNKLIQAHPVNCFMPTKVGVLIVAASQEQEKTNA